MNPGRLVRTSFERSFSKIDPSGQARGGCTGNTGANQVAPQ